jgi:hypothetical protein
MSYSGKRRQIINIGILAGKTFVQQPFKTTLSIPVIITVQIIPSHLIHYNSNNQFGSYQGCNHRLGNNNVLLNYKCKYYYDIFPHLQ